MARYLQLFKGRLWITGAILLMLTAGAAPSTAQGRGIEVRSISPELMPADPGGIFILAFRVANRRAGEETLREEVDLPDGWHLVIPLFDFILGPDREASRIVVLRAGHQQEAGDYTVRYGVTGSGDQGLTDHAAVRVILPPVHELSLMPEGPLPEQAIAGEPFSFQARLVNGGNVPLTVTMGATIPGGGSVLVEPGALSLAAGESRVIGVRGHADPALKRLRRQSVLLEAVCDQGKDGQPLAARLTVPLQVVPLVAGEDIYHRFPLELSAHFGGDGHRQGLQVALSGDGYLDESHRHRLEFSIRVPDRTDRALLADRDEYRVRYSTAHYTARAGDLAYGLSDLTSYNRYGRGAGAELHVPDSSLEAGLYHVVDRWSLQERRDTGAYLSHTPRPGTELRFNALRLDYDGWKRFSSSNDSLFSMQGNFDWQNRHRLEMELAYSRGDRHNMEMSRGGREGGAKGRAYRLSYHGSLFRDVRIALSSRRSGSDFSGRNSDSARHAASIALPLTGRLRFNASCNRYEGNLHSDVKRGSAPREDLCRGGLSLKLPRRWFLDMQYTLYNRADDVPATARRLREHSTRLAAGRSSGPLSYRVDIRRARVENILHHRDYISWNYDVSMTYRPRRSLFLSVSGGFGDEEHEKGESHLLRRERYFGGSFRWQGTNNFSVYGTYRRNDLDYPDQPMRERVDVDHYGAGLRYLLPNDHHLDFDIRRSQGSARDSCTTYHATYRIPIDIPVGRKKTTGSLSGRVSRAGARGETGLAGVVVYAGGTAARTDSDGRFQFLTLSPGEHELRLDERSTGGGLVVVDGASTSVTVTGGRTIERDIRLTESGSLAGQIVILQAAHGPGTGIGKAGGSGYLVGSGNGKDYRNGTAGGGAGTILVEMSRRADLRRTISDQQGRFLFEGLHPGEWTVKMYAHNLPDHHYPETPTLSVSIAPGVRQEIIAHVLPRLREINIIDEGRLGPEIGTQ